MPSRAVLWAAIALALAGCGDLPQPFLGNPGSAARRLAQPPPTRLSIPVPHEALLPDGAAETWAHAMAEALAAQEVPAVATEAPRKGDWQLVMAAEMQGGTVHPSYTVQKPDGTAAGVTDGAPVPASAWSDASPATLHAAAEAGVPGVVSLLGRLEAARRAADPNDLVNRPARLRFTGVKGAPGDGDTALAQQIRAKLAGVGQATQDSPNGADFTFHGEVVTEPGAGGSTRVTIQWIVVDATGDERGRVVQINEVPFGSLDHYWGDVAVAVAQEAAGGVKEVLRQQTGRRAPSSTPAGTTAPKNPA